VPARVGRIASGEPLQVADSSSFAVMRHVGRSPIPLIRRGFERVYSYETDVALSIASAQFPVGSRWNSARRLLH